MFPNAFYMTMTHRLLDATGVWHRALLSYGSGRVGAVEVLVGVPVSEALVVVTDATTAQLKGQTHCIHVQLPCYIRSKTLHSCTSVMFYKVRHCIHAQLSCSIWSETLHSCTTVTVYKDRDIAFMYKCHVLQGQRCTNAMSCKVRDVAVMYNCDVLQGQRCCSHVQLSCSTRSERLQSCTTVTFCFTSTADKMKVPGDVTYSMSPSPIPH